MFGWSIVLSMNSQVGFGNPEISECQKSYEAMLAGKWDIAKQLLADMKKRNIKIDPNSLSGFVEMSQSTIFNAKVLTGLRLFKEYGVDFREDNGQLLFIVANHDKWGQVTERLLQYGADPNKPWENSKNRRIAFTPLASAAMGHDNLVQAKLLLKYGALPDALSDMAFDEKGILRQHITPLMVAVRGRKPEFISLLLRSKAKVNLQCKEDGNTALHIAAQFDNSVGIKLLLQSGAKLSIRNKKNETALMVAKRHKSINAIAVLSK